MQEMDVKISLVSMPVQDPVKAHEIYTTKLGFVSKEFDPAANLAIVVSSEDPDGTAILLEPCQGSFAENYQKSAFDAQLLERLKSVGVKLRPELDRPDYGIVNVFEDGCGNMLMIAEGD